jgi:hypothetical protein
VTSPVDLPRWFTAEKPAGQFSRRHHTDEAHVAARERYRYERGPAARRRRAQERLPRPSIEERQP